jgi:fatty acid desaturase
MLSSRGPRLNTSWITPALVVFAVMLAVAVWFAASLSSGRFAVLLLNLVGTVFLASAFEPHLPKHGDGGWWESLKFAVRELPKYGAPPAFDFFRFYVGLFFLLLGSVGSVLLK